MDTSDTKNSERSRRYAERRIQEKAMVRVFSIRGEDVTATQHQCLIVGRSRHALRLISDEPLPVGERIDITVDLGRAGNATFSGIPRSLAVAYESSGYLVDVDLILDRHSVAWSRQFH